MMLDGAQRSICCSSLKTSKKQILHSAQDDMLGGFFQQPARGFSSLILPSYCCNGFYLTIR